MERKWTLRNIVRSEAGDPVVSVIILVYNDHDGIRITLDFLLIEIYPTEEYEVLAVDNGSADGTRDVIREFANAHDHVHLLVEDEIQGSYAARISEYETQPGPCMRFSTPT